MEPAYFETRFRSHGGAGWPEEFAIVTAHATTGETWTADENAVAADALTRELDARGLPRRAVTGYSPRTGHAEDGWAVALVFDEACDLGLRFHQDAIYYVRRGRLFVTFCDARREPILVGSFEERLDPPGDLPPG